MNRCNYKISVFQLLHSIRDRQSLKDLEELATLQNQIKVVRLQDKLGKQSLHKDLKKVFEPVTKSLENISQDITKTITETSSNNNKAIENINNIFLEIMNYRGILASYLMSPLSKIINPENTSQFKLVKESISNRVNDLLRHITIPTTFNNNLLTFRDTGKDFELQGDLLEMITNKNYNVDLAKLSDQKLIYVFAKGMKYDIEAIGKKSTRERTLLKIPKSPGLSVFPSSVSKTIFLSSGLDELCDKINLFLPENQAGNNSDLINDEVVAIVDNLLDYKCLSKKQHKQLVIKCNLFHK